MRFQLDGERGKRLLNGMAGFFHTEALLDGFQLVRWHGGVQKRRIRTAQLRHRPLCEFGNISVAFMNTALGFNEARGRDGLIRGNLLVGHHRTRAGKNDRWRLGRHERIAALLAARQACGDIRAQARTAGEQFQIGAGVSENGKLAVINAIEHRIAIAIAAQFGKAFTYPCRPLSDVGTGDQPGLAATLRVHQADEARVRHRRNRVVAHA